MTVQDNPEVNVDVLQKASDPKTFWFSLEVWFRALIVLTGAIPGFCGWAAFWSGLFWLIALAFLGHGNAALALQIFVICAIVLTFVLAIAGTPLVLFMIIFTFTHVGAKAAKSSSIKDFIFHK